MAQRLGRGAAALALMIVSVAGSTAVAATAHADDMQYYVAGTYPTKAHCVAVGKAKSKYGYYRCNKQSMFKWQLLLAK